MSEHNRLLSYLPEELRDVREFGEIANASEPECDLLANAVQQLLDDQFVETSSESGIARREKMLGIQADKKVESLEFRRQRIINRLSTKPPFTERFLQQRLDQLVGPGIAKVTVDVQNYHLYVTARIDDAPVFKEVVHTVQQVKPANVVYQQQTALHDAIQLVERISKAVLSRMTKLSTTWKLGVTPFAVRGEEEQIK